MEILFEDRDIIVLVKPVGVLSQSDKNGNISLVDILNRYLEEKGENCDIHVVHRLDREVGGVMVYAKNSFAASALSSSIQNGEMIKEYMAVVHSEPESESGFMEDLLFRDSKKNKTFIVNRERKGVKKAKLYYEKISTAMTRFGQATLVRIKLYTGRTHQIRVQFASRKMPLIGDKRYGGKDEHDIALFSYRLTFPHPRTGETMVFVSEENFAAIYEF